MKVTAPADLWVPELADDGDTHGAVTKGQEIDVPAAFARRLAEQGWKTEKSKPAKGVDKPTKPVSPARTPEK